MRRANNDKETLLHYETETEWHIQKNKKWDNEKPRQRFVNALHGKKILEIGVGGGRDVEFFLKNKLEIDGIDYAKNFVDHCKKRFPTASFRHGDIREIDLPPEKYNGIWAFASLLNLPKADMIKVLSKLATSLQQHGHIFISLKEGGGERMVPDKAGIRFWSFYRIEEIRKMLEEKFQVVYTDRISNYALTRRVAAAPKPSWIYVLATKK